MNITKGQKAPGFKLPDQNGRTHQLSDYEGSWLVLYFYPKDSTEGCTIEAQAFRDAQGQLSNHGLKVLGVSADSVASHSEFHKTQDLTFDILADEDREVIKAYDSLGDNELAERNTFLIDPDGIIEKVYESVDPESHAGEILQDIENIT